MVDEHPFGLDPSLELELHQFYNDQHQQHNPTSDVDHVDLANTEHQNKHIQEEALLIPTSAESIESWALLQATSQHQHQQQQQHHDSPFMADNTVISSPDHSQTPNYSSPVYERTEQGHTSSPSPNLPPQQQQQQQQSQQKQFQCSQCSLSFRRNHDLKRHVKIHLPVRPYSCDLCAKAFNRKDALRRHVISKACKMGPSKQQHQQQPSVPEQQPGNDIYAPAIQKSSSRTNRDIITDLNSYASSSSSSSQHRPPQQQQQQPLPVEAFESFLMDANAPFDHFQATTADSVPWPNQVYNENHDHDLVPTASTGIDEDQPLISRRSSVQAAVSNIDSVPSPTLIPDPETIEYWGSPWI